MVSENPAEDPNAGLFRREALLYSSQKSMGRATIVQPVTLTVITALIFVIVAAAVTYLALGEYARTERVLGYLESDSGRVEVFASSAGGIVHESYVGPGDGVELGQPLVALRFPRSASSSADLHADVIAELLRQKEPLEDQLNRHGVYAAAERDSLVRRVRHLKHELGEQSRLYSLQRRRIEVSDKLVSSADKLRASGGISEADWLRMVAEKLQQTKELTAIRQREVQITASLEQAEHELAQIDHILDDRKLQVESRLSQLNQRITEVSGRRDELITAPIAGRVVATQISEGAAVENGKSLMTIFPEGSQLEALLLLPSSAVGFLKAGQEIRLMYDTYPHQQFGTQTATLVTVSEAPIWAQHLKSPLKVEGPVFIAKAKLPKASFVALGQERPLQPGMLLSADIVLEHRTFGEWLLQPFYSLRGRG